MTPPDRHRLLADLLPATREPASDAAALWSAIRREKRQRRVLGGVLGAAFVATAVMFVGRPSAPAPPHVVTAPPPAPSIPDAPPPVRFIDDAELLAALKGQPAAVVTLRDGSKRLLVVQRR